MGLFEWIFPQVSQADSLKALRKARIEAITSQTTQDPCGQTAVAVQKDVEVEEIRVRGQSAERCCGFTLIELMVTVPILLIVFAAGTDTDLVDLVDRPALFRAMGMDTDSESLIEALREDANEDFTADVNALIDVDKRAKALIRLRDAGHRALPALQEAARSKNKELRAAARLWLPKALKASRERNFLVEVVCRELGARQAEAARPVLSSLSRHPDYFVSKHARKSLAMIDQPPTKDIRRQTIPREIRGLLPDSVKTVASMPGDPRRDLQNLLRNLHPAGMNQLVTGVNRAVGNFEVSKVHLLSHEGPDGQGDAYLLLLSGRFDQEVISSWLVARKAKAKETSKALWVGRLEEGATIAMYENRYLVISISFDGAALDEHVIVKIAKAMKEEVRGLRD